MRIHFQRLVGWSLAVCPAVVTLTAAMPPTAASILQSITHLEFAAASIKRLPPGPAVAGQMFACHGTDGYRRALFGHFNPAVAAQGRCAGSGVHLVDLISLAYGIAPEFISGGPDWVYLKTGPSSASNIAFQIEAVAEDPSKTTTEELRQMLQTMLADRFKLKLHHEMREVPGYVLLLAKNGPKLKEASGQDEPPSVALNDKGRLVLRGKSRLDLLAQLLVRWVPRAGEKPAPVLDKTGLTGTYDYDLLFPPPMAGQRGATAGGGEPPNASDLSAMLENQLGLRLQREIVSFGVIVVDQAELPSPN
jgi:uncharacterized protein (TIGR03435 family)